MGASVVWTLPVEGIDLKARFNVYNLFDNQKSLNLHSRYEAAPGLLTLRRIEQHPPQ